MDRAAQWRHAPGGCSLSRRRLATGAPLGRCSKWRRCLPDEGSSATLDEVPDGSSTALERVIAGVIISFLPHANQSGRSGQHAAG